MFSSHASLKLRKTEKLIQDNEVHYSEKIQVNRQWKYVGFSVSLL